MSAVTGREIAVTLSFSEEIWDALTDDLRGLLRESGSDVGDMELNERVDLFVGMQVSDWLSVLPEHLRATDLTDDVPF